MPEFEVCRVINGLDKKQQENQWWEARLITAKGEEVIHRVDYIDEKYRSSLKRELQAFFPGFSHEEERRLKSEELFQSSHACLIALLMQDGWESAGTNQAGMVTMMKRVKP